MSLNWQWSDKMGSFEIKSEHPEAHKIEHNIYQGNALMIATHENTETDEYTLSWFAADKDHLKNMLGLNTKGGYEECFSTFGITKLRLNTRYPSVAWIVQQMAKAKLNITIELYYEEAK